MTTSTSARVATRTPSKFFAFVCWRKAAACVLFLISPLSGHLALRLQVFGDALDAADCGCLFRAPRAV